MWSSVPLTCLLFEIVTFYVSRAAALKGAMSVCSYSLTGRRSLRLGWRPHMPGRRPLKSGWRQQKPGWRPQRPSYKAFRLGKKPLRLG